MPVIKRFTQFVERLLPDRTSPLTRYLDPAALANTIVAIEAVRRTVARAIESICGSINAVLATASNGDAVQLEKAASVTEAADALHKALEFMSDVNGPPETDDEQRRVTSTLHALDHATRLAEIAGEAAKFRTTKGGSEDVRAAQLCAEAMKNASLVAGEVVAHSAALDPTAPIETGRDSLASPDADAILDTPVVRLEQSASALGELRLVHRSATLNAVATGELTADEAILRVDMVTRFEALARHAWRSVAHLIGRSG
jgi:phosphate:Na+ symporter